MTVLLRSCWMTGMSLSDRICRPAFSASRPFATLVTIALLLLAAASVHAQDEPVIVSRKAGPVLYAFTDTTSARIELNIPAGAALKGAAATAKIISTADNSTLWSGPIGTITVDDKGIAHLAGKVSGLTPKYWSPQTPALYQLTVNVANQPPITTRIGFKTMTAKNGQLLLNGHPIFLKGNAINPPERQIPDSLQENRRFVEPYVRYLKSVGVNIIRLTRHSQVWFDVCDEQGMMLFQGNYGTPRGGKANAPPTGPFSTSLAWYKDDVLGPLVNHPSVTVYILSNEQADREIGYLSAGADQIGAFLKQAYDSLHAWDSTRPYITNAGYGFGRSGDVCDLHRYWGWYYNSFLSFYTMRYPATCWRTPVAQPMTMSENTGNYTGVDGRFNLVSNTKQPDSQLNWTGHAPESEQSARALAYQAWMGGQAIEIYRRTREQNPNLAGLTPFTILFHNWWGITKFEDMKPKPLGAQYGVSYQPVLLSWELWTPQVYAGSTITPVAHVVNDDERYADLSGLSVQYAVVDGGGKRVVSGRTALPDVKYYGARSTPLSIVIPANAASGSYTLTGVITRGTDTLSRNTTSLFIAPSTVPGAGALKRAVAIYDPAGNSRKALASVGVSSRNVTDVKTVKTSELLVIGAEAWNETLGKDAAALRQFVKDGGRMIILHQDARHFDGTWLAAPIKVKGSELDHALVFPGDRPFMNGMAVNPERPDHPALRGISRDRLFLWNDYTGWNETKPGFPQVYPVTHGFVFTDNSTLGKAAVIANYDHGLEGIALAEVFDGTGSVLVTGFDLVNRSGKDPIADRMLANIVGYMADDQPHSATLLVSDRIVWGDYASEHGLVTGIYNGLLVNTVPVVPADIRDKYPITVDAQGFWFAGGTSGWNTKPAIQYVARGRRPFGPYTFTTGGAYSVDKKNAIGEGRVWLRIPDGRTTMTTTVQNPVAEAIDLDLSVNGTVQKIHLNGNETKKIDSPVHGGDAPLAIVFRGDRRLVLLETEFR
ncbi:MAG: glycoside hydrolase family 2 barrel [Gemmatimonadetes bacterium]|nr:glycoside hydrolase family 2 barrel [Gemmatimonadota bacterium]